MRRRPTGGVRLAQGRRSRRLPTVAAWTLGLLAAIWALAWLAACGGTDGGPTLTVAGRVLAPGGVPAAGVVVLVQGLEAVTDAAGRFTLDGVEAPYDLVLGSTAGDGWMHVVEGLTEADPVIGARWAKFTAGGITTVSGSLAGGAMPVGHRTWICAEGLDAPIMMAQPGRVGEGGDAFAMTVFQLGEGPVAARLHALELSYSDADEPLAYHGYATVDATVENGVPATADLPVLGPVASATLTGTILPPGGGLLWMIGVDAVLGPRTVLPLYRPPLAPQPNSVALPVPVLGGGVRLLVGAFVGEASSIAWRTLEDTAFGTLHLPVPPQLLLPADGADGVTAETPYSVATAADGGVTFVWQALGGGPDVALTTRRREVTMPDAALLGLAVPAGAPYRWSVEAAGTLVGAAAATLASLEDVSMSLQLACGWALPGDGEIAVSARREFVFAP